MSEGATILVVDDEASNRESLEKILTREGYQVEQFGTGSDVITRLRGGGVSLVLTDLKMPGMTGNDLLKAIKAIDPDVEVIVMTAYGTVEIAVEAMKMGAWDFISKPFRRMEIVKTVRQALERQSLQVENRRLRQKLVAGEGLGGRIIGQSAGMRAVMELVARVAASSATVLVQGESGTGKELIAQAIHDLSPRAGRRYVKLNCGALPESLLESELFGYEPGAFTGAAGRKEGRFELASGGSLFLDEVGELTLASQVKLLRVLQEGEFERLGGTRTLKVDVRLIAATNKDLEQLVREGRFREDLFYRLNVIQVQLPPLRERVEDIPPLATHFLRQYATKNNRDIGDFSQRAMEALQAYRWPGNVRELENTLERAVVLARGDQITVDDLPAHLRGGKPSESPRTLSFTVGTPLRDVETRLILETLRHTGGDKNLAANLLGINARTIYRRLEELREEEGREII